VKRLIVIILLSLCLIAPYVDIDKPLPSYMDKWTCMDVVDIYRDSGSLYQLSVEEYGKAKSPATKMFWGEVKKFTLSLHQPLLQALRLKCKAA